MSSLEMSLCRLLPIWTNYCKRWLSMMKLLFTDVCASGLSLVWLSRWHVSAPSYFLPQCMCALCIWMFMAMHMHQQSKSNLMMPYSCAAAQELHLIKVMAHAPSPRSGYIALDVAQSASLLISGAVRISSVVVSLIGYEQMSHFQAQTERERERERACLQRLCRADILIRIYSSKAGTNKQVQWANTGTDSFLNYPVTNLPPPAVVGVLISQY